MTKKCVTMVIWFWVYYPQDYARSHLELGSASRIGMLILTSKNFESSTNTALAIVLVGKNSFLTLKLVRSMTLSPPTCFSHLANAPFSKTSWPGMMKISWRVGIHCRAQQNGGLRDMITSHTVSLCQHSIWDNMRPSAWWLLHRLNCQHSGMKFSPRKQSFAWWMIRLKQRCFRSSLDKVHSNFAYQWLEPTNKTVALEERNSLAAVCSSLSSVLIIWH